MGLCRYVLLGWSFDIVNINSIFYEVIQQETKNNNKKNVITCCLVVVSYEEAYWYFRSMQQITNMKPLQ